MATDPANGNGATLEHNGNGAHDGNGAPDTLPPPPPVPPNVTPMKVGPEPESQKVVRYPMARRGSGTKGSKVQILTNHFKVNVSNLDGNFFHYSVCIHILLIFRVFIC